MVKDLLPHIKHCCVLNSYHQEQKTKVKKKIVGRVKPKEELQGSTGYIRSGPRIKTTKARKHTRLAQTPPKNETLAKSTFRSAPVQFRMNPRKTSSSEKAGVSMREQRRKSAAETWPESGRRKTPPLRKTSESARSLYGVIYELTG